MDSICEDLLLKLHVITRLYDKQNNQDRKLRIEGDVATIDYSNSFNFVTRWWTNNNCEKTEMFLRKTYKICDEIIDTYLHSTYVLNQITLSNKGVRMFKHLIAIKNALMSSKDGIESLKITYRKRSKMCALVDQLLDKSDHMIELIENFICTTHHKHKLKVN